MGTLGARGGTYSALSSVPFLLSHITSVYLSASQTSIFPRYLAYSKSSSQTYLAHCQFNKLDSYNCSSNLFIWPPQILPFKHGSIPSTLFCHAWLLFLLVFSLPLPILLPSAHLWLGSFCSVPCCCLYMVLHWGTPCCRMLCKLKVLVGSLSSN